MKLHIDRIELELHGDIDAGTAQQAAELLGPALAAALRAGQQAEASGATLRIGARPDAATLAGLLARQLAPHLSPHLSPHSAAQPTPRHGSSIAAPAAAPDREA